MNTIILACRTLETELTAAIKKTRCIYPVYWTKSGLHTSPDLLREHIQHQIDSFANIDRMLLLFGFCGNALLDISVPEFEVVFPKVDDCITLLLGSAERRKSLPNNTTSYFITKGWLEYERNIWEEFQYSIKRFGEELGKEINNQILRHYSHLQLIDTGCHDNERLAKETERMAGAMGLKHGVIPGSVDYIEKLLTGPYDKDFAIIPPGHRITREDLSLTNS